MKRKKRHLRAEFKARISTETLKGIHSVNDIAQENAVVPSWLVSRKRS
ncbi:hypothetical protein [Rubritalea sp.]